jgi:cobalt-zinc-cadmium efflux system membrane fusion protein
MNYLSLHLSKQSKRYAFSAAALFIVLGWGTAAQAQSHAGHDHGEEAAHGESHETHAGHDHSEEAEPGESHEEHAGHDDERKEAAGHDDHADEGDGHRDEAEHDHAEEKAHGESHEAHGDHDDHGEAGGHDDHEEGGPVQLTAEVRNEFGIILDRASPGTLHEEVVLPGEIRFNRKAIAFATPRYNGSVQKINAQLADRVKKGDVLAVLESVDTLRPFEVKAPFDGVIVSYDITPGQTVDAGTSLFTVADLSTVWADLQIYQKNFGQIKEGLKVRITGGHNLPTFRGVIDYVAPTVDEHTRTGLARIVVDNAERAWKPGMFIKGRVAVERHPVDLMVPRSAVLTVEGAPAVFVQTAEGFEPRPIQIGHSDSEYVQVVRGLEAGETYVAKNPISIKAEMGKGSFGGHNH